MRRKILNVIDGLAQPAASDNWTTLIDPATGDVSGEAPLSDGTDIETAVASSMKAFTGWSRLTPGERCTRLNTLADRVLTRLGELVEAEILDTGKPRQSVIEYEVMPALEELRFFAGATRVMDGLATQEFRAGHTSTVRREPIGVVGQIAPWNYPFMMTVWKLGPALAVGNTVVLKPSESTPSSAYLLAQIATEVLGPGVLNVVNGGRATGADLVAHSDLGMVAITGSTRAGRAVAASAAENVMPVHLELGGNGVAVIAPDADVEEIAAMTAMSAFYNAGQDCTALTRFIIHDSVYDRFVKLLLEAVAKIRVGAPDERNVLYGPLNSEQQLKIVQGYLDRLPSHARVLTGGSRLDRPGFFFAPTLIEGVKQDDEIVQQEVFGPVATLQKYSSDAEALAMANGTRYGLAASIWTNDIKRSAYFTKGIRAGTVWVNCHLLHNAETPHGGVKQSGYGRDLSKFALEEYTQIKHVMTFTEAHYPLLRDDGSVAW
ncbi:aldehyde dehydrogenase family protein [Pseudofrankia sp. BMG5.36]|uniref:aldehyde dehydrogenase family protein n=1 Tax=Pseudofrankia sp. BMG5.36 TaxID=1834512 RepID=UPI000A5E6A95|nr:aldehyde dehydrogenase family protein [Pseudofrankia sp. BMG5.36]